MPNNNDKTQSIEFQEILKEIYQHKINVDEKMILERLNDRHRWPKKYLSGLPSLERIIRDDGFKTQDFFHPIDNYPRHDAIKKIYEDGYTIVISQAQWLFDDISILTERLSTFFDYEIQANMYLSKGKKIVSYPYHDHDYSVIIKGIFGRSKWLINDEEKILENQEVFFVDKFVKHCVKEIYDTKFSITFNLLR
jgi:hypothetical protein